MEEEEEGGTTRTEAFLKWAAEVGITDSPSSTLSQAQAQSSSSSSCLGKSLFVSHFPDAGGRGLAAARDLRKQELILKVPKAALMTRETLMSRDQKLRSLIAKHPHLSSTQLLSVCLLAEMGKGRSSWWHPYLMQLPRSYDTLASFNRFETRALQVDDAIWAAEKASSEAESEWKMMLTLMQELEFKPKLLTFRAWLWASATISSRTMHIPWDDAGCLCPVGDFFNYSAPGEDSICSEDDDNSTLSSSLQVCSLLVDENKEEKLKPEQNEQCFQRLIDAGYEENVSAYCFYAKKDYRKGEQVLLSYGTYTNLELLEHYGFLLNANPNEKVFIDLEPRAQLLSSWPKQSIYIQSNGKPSFALLAALRLWATPPPKRKSVTHLAYSGLRLSPENEISVMRWVGTKCHILLDKAQSSIEEDIWLLNFIDKLQSNYSGEAKQMPLACEVEIDSFFEANGLQKEAIGKSLFPRKARRSLERWKLAIRWRFRYKQILVHCISHCTETINRLSSQPVPGHRTKCNT